MSTGNTPIDIPLPDGASSGTHVSNIAKERHKEKALLKETGRGESASGQSEVMGMGNPALIGSSLFEQMMGTPIQRESASSSKVATTVDYQAEMDHMEQLEAMITAAIQRVSATGDAVGTTMAPVTIPKFTKDGLEKMFRYNAEVLRSISEAIAELNRDSPNPKAIADSLTEAKSKVAQRMKMIRIADKHGWNAASIYEGGGELGEDAEDNRKIRAAVAEVEKMKKRADFLKKVAPRGSFTPANPGGGPWPFRYGGSWNLQRPQPYPYSTGPRNSFGCFICQSPNHWARACPKTSIRGQPASFDKKTA